MPPRLIPLAVLLGAATAQAEDHPATGWREALAVEFESVPARVSDPSPEPSPLRPGVPLPVFEDDPETIVLPAMTISALRARREMDQVFERADAMRKSRELSWKGGPLYETKIGPAKVGVYSILYVPVLFHGSISW